MSISPLKLLIIEPDEEVLKERRNKLTKDKHDVSTTRRAKSGILMLINGFTYDCIVIDDECNDMDLIIFLHQIMKHRPKQSVIVMGSKETREQIAKMVDHRHKTISYILKPCEVYSEISRGLQYVVSQRMGFEEGTSSGNLHERNLAHNIFHRADTLIKPSTVMNTPMINHNIPSTYGTHAGLNLNSQKYGVMCKTQNQVNISSDDGESSMKSNICTNLANNKGTQPIFDLKRKSYQPVDDIIKPRTGWTRKLTNDFKTLSSARNKEKTFPSTNPIMLANMPGLKGSQVASHQQMIYHERNNCMINPAVPGPLQIRYSNSQVKSYGSRSFARSIPFGNDALSSIQFRKFQKLPMTLNSTGKSLMSLDNIQTHFDDSPHLNWPQQTTTIINNSGGDLFQPPTGETSMSNAVGLFDNPENGTVKGLHEVQNTVFGYGTGIEPLVTTEFFSQNTFGNIEMAPPSSAMEESELRFSDDLDNLSQVIGATPISSDLGLLENIENGTGDQGILEGQSAVAPSSVGGRPQHRFSNGFDELSQALCGLVENHGSGNGQGSENQTEAVSYGLGTMPLVTTAETFPQQMLGEAMAPLSVGTPVGLVNHFANDFGTTNFTGTGDNSVSEVLAPVDCYGIPIENSWEIHGDSAATMPNDFNLEDLDFPIVEGPLDPEKPLEINFSNLDSISFGDASASATLSVASNGSADNMMENDWFVRMVNYDQEICNDGLAESCGHLINGTFGSEDSPWSI